MKTHLIVWKLALILVLGPYLGHAQTELKTLEGPNLISETEIYTDHDGNHYARFVYLKFAGPVIDMALGTVRGNIEDVDVNLGDLRDLLTEVSVRYGAYALEKVFPNAAYGDSLRINRAGEHVAVPDRSQVFRLVFDNVVVPVDELSDMLSAHPMIMYAHGPTIALLVDQPNDWAYVPPQSYQWELDRIMAPYAWALTKGSTTDGPIQIAVHDNWLAFNVPEPHPDLDGRLYNPGGLYGGHGSSVAGFAGAITNNGSWVASLGWDVTLRGYQWSTPNIATAVDDGADVINFSWITDTDAPLLRERIEEALLLGVVLVASAGNYHVNDITILPHQDPQSFVYYPAAYNFPTLGMQVIAVSGTDNEDKFVEEVSCPPVYEPTWNFSPGTNPLSDPTTAFIDVAAPGRIVFRIVTVRDTLGEIDHTGGLPCRGGTSYSAPIVSALAALILSINPSLAPSEVYEIITSTTDKVGQYSYGTIGMHGNSWNRYLGYGRINAYEALKYTIENYGGVLGGPGEVITFHESINLQENAVLTIRSGTEVNIARSSRLRALAGSTLHIEPGVTFKLGQNGGLNITGSSTIIGTQANPIRFEQAVPGQRWSDILVYADNTHFQWCVFDGGNKTVEVFGNNVRFENSTFRNGVRGVSSYWKPQGGRSSFILTSSLVESNSTVGVVAFHSDPEISFTTIRNNGQAGLWLNNAQLIGMWSTLIEENATVSTTRSGLEIVSNGWPSSKASVRTSAQKKLRSSR